jgi:Na+-driven multidrug efflux pump
LLRFATVPFVAACLAAPTLWPRLFTDDMGIVAAAGHNGRYFACGLIFMGLAQVASSGLIALGLPFRMVAVIFVKNLVITIPLMYAVSQLHLQPLPDSVFIAQVVSAPVAWLLAEWFLLKAVARPGRRHTPGSAAADRHEARKG